MVLSDSELGFLQELLRLKTTHDPENREEHQRCRSLLSAEAEKHGLKTKIIGPDPYPSMIVGVDPEFRTPALALSAHLDVVPGAAEMFEPRLVGDRLEARGASDMKFCVPLFFKAIDELEPAFKAKVQITFTFDEEIGGNQGTRYLLDEYGYRPRSCFIPDGGDNFQIEASEKGVLQFRVRTTGRSAHGSRPWLGENAVDKFLAIYADLRRTIPFVTEPGEWGPTLNLGKILGGTAANQVPDACEALLDTRFTESASLADTAALIRSVIGDRGEFSPVVEGDLFHLDPANPCYRMVQRAARQHLGHDLPIYRSEGASDARFFTQYRIPVVITKPICGGHHSTDEWLDLSSLETYYRIVLDFTRQAASTW